MNKIKYDKKDKKIYFILSVVTTIILAVCLSVLMWDKDVEFLSSMLYASLIIVASFFLPVLSFAMWVMFFDSHMYLMRLKMHGFVIPNNKKDYDSDLDKLADDEENGYGKHSGELAESKESKALAFISWFIALGMIGYTVFFFIRFSHMLENVGFFGILSIFITICWFVFGFNYFKQRDAKKYRDDVDYKSPLKTRKHLVEGIATIVILLAITAIAATNFYTMSKYVERSKENPEEIVQVVDYTINI